jgi:L-serine dehydratase
LKTYNLAKTDRFKESEADSADHPKPTKGTSGSWPEGPPGAGRGDHRKLTIQMEIARDQQCGFPKSGAGQAKSANPLQEGECMSVFDIIGPIMIGPSSSHTAGAVRLGLAARAIIGGQVSCAAITLHGSFAETYHGHGTDIALVAGLLGMSPDDARIPNAMQIALEQGLKVRFQTADLGDVHPNSAQIELVSPDGAKRSVRGASVGGGSILITKIDRFSVDFTGENHALVVSYKDQPGIIAKITSLLAAENVNIAAMRVSRQAKHSQALAIIELDQPAPEKSIAKIAQVPSVDTLMVLPPISLEEGV